MNFMLSATLAHLVADFILQSDRLVEDKNLLKAGSHLYHGFVVLICSAIALHTYGSLGLELAALLSVLHTAIDYLKSRFFRRDLPGQQLPIFIADQLLHILAIAVTWELAQPNPSVTVVSFYSNNFMPHIRELLGPSTTMTLNDALAITTGYTLAAFAGVHVVKHVLSKLCLQADPKSNTGSGRYIGMLERALMVTLILTDSLPSIAFVIAAKSLARFKQLEDAAFAEYYLVGTMSSTLLAIVVGLALRAALRIL